MVSTCEGQGIKLPPSMRRACGGGIDEPKGAYALTVLEVGGTGSLRMDPHPWLGLGDPMAGQMSRPCLPVQCRCG